MFNKISSVISFLIVSSRLFAQDNPSGIHVETIPIHTLNDGSISVPISMSYNGSGVLVGSNPSNLGQNWSLNAGGQITRQIRSKPDEMVENPKTGTFLGQFFNDINSSTYNSANLVQKDTEKDIFVLDLNGLNVPFILGTKNQAFFDCYKYYDNIILLNKNVDVKIEFLQYTSGCELTIPVPDNIIVRGSNLTNPAVQNGLDIDLSRLSLINHFRVTTPDGIQYYFGLTVESKEYGMSYQTYLDQNQLCTLDGRSFFTSPVSWKLSKIVYPKGTSSILGGPNKPDSKFQEVNFSYKRTQSLQKTIISEKPFTIYSTECLPVQRTETDPKKMPLILNSELKKIESDNFVIDFNSDFIFSLANSLSNSEIIDGFSTSNYTEKTRIDIPSMLDYPNLMDENLPCLATVLGQTNQINNPFKNPALMPKAEILKNILITDKISGKKLAFFFDHNYLRGYKFDKISNSKNNILGRLSLKGFYQINLGENNKIMPGYKFLYNPIPLPDYDSFAKDHWGYYNGQDQNENKSGLIEVPAQQVLDGLSLSSFTCSGLKSNLNVNENFSQAGILTNIKLPTGAEKILKYENHTSEDYYEYSEFENGSLVKRNKRKIGGLRIKQIANFEPVKKEYAYKEFKYEKEGSTLSSGVLNIWPAYIFSYSNSFVSSSNVSGFGVVVPNHINQISDRFVSGPYIYYSRIKTSDFVIHNNVVKTLGFEVSEFYNNIVVGLNNRYQIYNGSVWVNDDNQTTGYTYSKNRDTNTQPLTDQLNGYIVKRQIFNANNTLLSEENFTYSSPVLQHLISQLYFSSPYQISYKPLIGNCNNVPLVAEDIKSNGNPIKQIAISVGIEFTKALVKRAAVNYLQKFATERALSQSLNSLSPFTYAAQIIILSINSLVGPIDCSSYLENPNTIAYILPIYDIKLISKSNKTYDVNGLNEKISYQTYYYDPANRFSNPKSIITTYSTSNEILEESIINSKEFNFPQNIIPTDPYLNNMKKIQSLGMILPVESLKKRNGKVLSGNFYDYFIESGYEGKVKNVYQLELDKPVTNFTSAQMSNLVFTRSNLYKPFKENLTFNTKGLLSSYRNIVTNGSDIISMPKTNLFYTHNDLVLSQVESETHGLEKRSTFYQSVPIYGVTETLNPDGQKQINEYDDLGRLKIVKDKNLNILKSYVYNEKKLTPISIFNFTINDSNEELFSVSNNSINPIAPGLNNLNLKGTVDIGSAKSFEIKIFGPFLNNSYIINGNSNLVNIDISSFLNANTVQFHTFEITAYSEENRIGDIVAYSKISFAISQIVNPQRRAPLPILDKD